MATGKLESIMVRQEESMERVRPDSGTDEAVETATIFSDANSILGHPRLGQYVMAFANQLVACQPPGFETKIPGGSLDRLLKAFAVRLSHEMFVFLGLQGGIYFQNKPSPYVFYFV